jgi:hypothetical protein
MKEFTIYSLQFTDDADQEPGILHYKLTTKNYKLTLPEASPC